jgi:hypothetical protein
LVSDPRRQPLLLRRLGAITKPNHVGLHQAQVVVHQDLDGVFGLAVALNDDATRGLNRCFHPFDNLVAHTLGGLEQ